MSSFWRGGRPARAAVCPEYRWSAGRGQRRRGEQGSPRRPARGESVAAAPGRI